MSQNSVNFSGDPTGDELLDDLLTPQQQNFLTSHSGTSRPAYAQQGTEWLDTTSTPWIVKRFDGTDDIIVGYVNASTNTFTPAGLILDKVDATAAPTINDDNADGYSVGSKWIDVTNDIGYLCVDASTGAAVWKEITGSLTGPGGSSVDNEIALFSGTSARVIKRATGTGYVKVTSGVMQTPVATIPLTDLANQAANSVLANATGSSAPPTAVTLAASKLFGRGASGNVGEIALGTRLSMSGSTLNVDVLTANNRQVFTSSGTWNKPAGYDSSAMVYIQVWGAGGSGAGSGNQSGNNGGSSSFGSYITAYGGGGAVDLGTGGAGGGWFANANTNSNDTNEGSGGSNSNNGGNGWFTGGGGYGSNSSGSAGKSVYGGGGGGPNGTSMFGGNGASAIATAGTAPGGGGTAGGGFMRGGGGGGSYKELWIPISALGSSETVTVGAGGASISGSGAGARGEVRITVFG